MMSRGSKGGTEMTQTLRIEVQQLTGDSAITLDEGQRIYDQIHPMLLADHDVELDFSGVDIIASPFLNAAIGHLLQDIEPDRLNRRLRFLNLAPTGQYTLRRVIENAKRYYADPKLRRAVDKEIETLSQGVEA